MKACNVAQTEANEDLEADEVLTSFPAPTYNTFDPAFGRVQVTQTNRYSLKFDANNVQGVNG